MKAIRRSSSLDFSGPRWAAPTEIALRASSLGSIGLCIGLWVRAKTVDQNERGNAERRALFVGLWPPMIWLIADTVADEFRRGRR